MRWRRRTQRPAASPEAERRIREAQQARESSEEGLAEVRDRWPEVNRVTSSLRRLRERNGFDRIFSQTSEGNGQ
jgi:hypothetical protein